MEAWLYLVLLNMHNINHISSNFNSKYKPFPSNFEIFEDRKEGRMVFMNQENLKCHPNKLIFNYFRNVLSFLPWYPGTMTIVYAVKDTVLLPFRDYKNHTNNLIPFLHLTKEETDVSCFIYIMKT